MTVAYKHYYVNDIAQANGDYEVHAEGCSFFPNSRTYLGYYSDCRDAVNKAKER
jgi:hypothetical protein